MQSPIKKKNPMGKYGEEIITFIRVAMVLAVIAGITLIGCKEGGLVDKNIEANNDAIRWGNSTVTLTCSGETVDMEVTPNPVRRLLNAIRYRRCELPCYRRCELP